MSRKLSTDIVQLKELRRNVKYAGVWTRKAFLDPFLYPAMQNTFAKAFAHASSGIVCCENLPWYISINLVYSLLGSSGISSVCPCPLSPICTVAQCLMGRYNLNILRLLHYSQTGRNYEMLLIVSQHSRLNLMLVRNRRKQYVNWIVHEL